MLKKARWSVLLGTAILVLAGCSSFRPVAGVAHVLPVTGIADGSVAAPEARPNVGRTILMYLPNRLLDITDIVSLHVGIPRLPHLVTAYPVHANAHVTRGMQVGFGISEDTLCVGKQYECRVMPWLQSYEEVSVGPVTLCTLEPTSGNDAIEFKKVGMLWPTDLPFADHLLDYWAVGAQATVISVSAGAEVHPLEIADFLAWLFLVDLGDDDF